MTAIQFLLFVLGVGLFAWLHPDLARLLLLVAFSRWIWKWSA